MKDKQRKPKTQSGFASFSMHELAELIVFEDDRLNALGRGEYFTKPIQNNKTRK